MWVKSFFMPGYISSKTNSETFSKIVASYWFLSTFLWLQISQIYLTKYLSYLRNIAINHLYYPPPALLLTFVLLSARVDIRGKFLPQNCVIFRHWDFRKSMIFAFLCPKNGIIFNILGHWIDKLHYCWKLLQCNGKYYILIFI